ncbi:RNA polymerase factor sigma-54 [candidate division KSB1 bacterium]
MIRLEQRFSLQQRLSPQHVLFSTLLQMPVMALEQKIKLELEQNPLLEDLTELDIDQDQNEETVDPVDEELKDDDPDEESKEEKDKEEEFDIDDFLNDDDGYEYNPVYRDPEEEDYRPDPAPVSLAEHLLSQFHFNQLSDIERAIGEYLIWNINEDGYLASDLETLVQKFPFSPDTVFTVEQFEKVLKVIQTLDPIGIGARDLRECLIIQLRDRENANEISLKILEKYFEDLKNKRYEKLMKNLDVSSDDIKEAIETISKLNPKPGEGYFSTNENYIIPDMTIEKVGGEYIAYVNDSNIPRLRINNAYRRMLTDGSNVSSDTKKYIHQKLESARWLINSIHQRKLTMIKVTNEIIKRQLEFFEKGRRFIKPMILKDIATAIDMDISTISRVTNGKYVQTDYGVFELKYFFSDRMTTDSGDEISTIRLKNQIKEIIENEDPKKPLTDGHISEMVAKTGIPIARRTVAKYREQMMIPVARLRRKL